MMAGYRWTPLDVGYFHNRVTRMGYNGETVAPRVAQTTGVPIREIEAPR